VRKRRLNPICGVRIGLSEPCHGPSLPYGSHSAGLHPSCRMLPCGVSQVPCWNRRMVPAGRRGSEWRSLADSRRTMDCSWQIRQYRVAYLPPHLSFLAGRYRGTGGSAAKADAARPNLDHDERVRQRADGSQARSKRESRQEGTEERITMQRNPQTHQKTLGVFGGAVIWGYLGLANRLNGCGGRI